MYWMSMCTCRHAHAPRPVVQCVNRLDEHVHLQARARTRRNRLVSMCPCREEERGGGRNGGREKGREGRRKQERKGGKEDEGGGETGGGRGERDTDTDRHGNTEKHGETRRDTE